MSIDHLSPAACRALGLIEAAALAGERCPQNTPHGPLVLRSVTELYRAGVIRGEVYRDNYRVITLLAGPHAGKSTAAPQRDHGAPLPKPYLVIDRAGSLYLRRIQPSESVRKIAP